MRRWVLAAVVTLAASTLVAAPAAAEFVAATPAPGSIVARGAYYQLPLGPGASLAQKLRVFNPNDHAVTVDVEAVDAATSDQTGAMYGSPGSAKAGTSRWVVVSSPEITMKPRETRDIPFTVQVPAGTPPGQYLAGVSASVPIRDAHLSGTNRPNTAGFAIAVQSQRLIAVEVDVPGPRAPQLVVTGVDPKATPGGVALGLHLANRGNAFAHGKGVVRVADTNTDYEFNIDTFVSGTAIVYSMPWTKTVVPGTHHVEVDLTYEGGRRTSWNGDIVIAGATESNLESQLRGLQVHHGVGFSLWLLLAALAAVALVGAAVTVRRRSRRATYVKYRAA